MLTSVRIQIVHPAEHALVAELPFDQPLSEWDLPRIHSVLGLHRHVVRSVTLGDQVYVVKELSDPLAEREYRLLRWLAERNLPTSEVVSCITDRPHEQEGLLVSRHLEYSLPYRSLLMGRGLQIPFLGTRMLDAMVVLLTRLHLAGFFWGDCSLNNTLFRRDAGSLTAYIIDVETGEEHPTLSAGQRMLDIDIASTNLAGGLFDLQASGKLVEDIDPVEVADDMCLRYERLWAELTGPSTAPGVDLGAVRERIERLHQLGFDVGEMELIAAEDGNELRFVPRVVEHGFHADRLQKLTGLVASENQARRMLNDIKQYRVALQQDKRRPVTENMAAVRWLDERFEPLLAGIPDELSDRLESAEMFHQILEHRWYLNENAEDSVTLEEARDDYLKNFLAPAPEERVRFEDPDGEIEKLLPDALAPDAAVLE